MRDEYPAPPMDFRGPPPPMHHYPEHRPPYDDFRGRYSSFHCRSACVAVYSSANSPWLGVSQTTQRGTRRRL